MDLLNKTRRFKAFTMAEAILVMTILGIIATIMITTLKPAEFKEKSLKVLAKKVLSEIDTATTQVMINNSKLNDMETLLKADGTSFEFATDSAETMKLYKKYLTTIRTAPNTKSFCMTGDSSSTTALTNITAVYLKDGSCMGLLPAGSNHELTRDTVFPGEEGTVEIEATQGFILFDTNGLEEPNTISQDQFVMPIDKNGILYEAP